MTSAQQAWHDDVDGTSAYSGNDSLARLNRLAATMGVDIVDVAGFLDDADRDAHAQIGVLDDVAAKSESLGRLKSEMLTSITEAATSRDQAREAAHGSVEALRASAEDSRSVSQWVGRVEAQMKAVETTLASVAAANTQISDIARQVNMLAINAKIEAARAGEAGKGFSVVADAVNELSQRTTQVADGITDSVSNLVEQVHTLQDEATQMSSRARAVLDTSDEADKALAGIADSMTLSAAQSDRAAETAGEVGVAVDAFGPAIHGLTEVLNAMATGIHDARERVNALIDDSEGIVQTAVELGGASQDQRFIDLVRDAAAQVSAAFEAALDRGQTTEAALFDRNYRPIPGTNPEQLLSGFTELTDRLLPPIQEPILDASDRIVFCAAVDQNGYLPTHNKKFSAPQGDDPTWNAANSRNRRMFDDRVGLKAGRNTAPFLLQTYRRDMGGGKFVLMKDVSSPITVKGRHWGGLRVAFKPT